MNHIYRVIWNVQNACWQAVCETAKGKGKSSKASTTRKSNTLKLLAVTTTVVGSMFGSISTALAAPTGGIVSSGTATIAASGTTTTINQTTPKAAIDWSSFSTTATETINFVQPNSNAITLNRVTGTSASSLSGKLNANGQVFIINPNGILFGSTSQVNVGGLVASTLGLSNADFINNTFRFSNSTNNKSVENRGKITVPTGGTVALIAPTIKHTGTITTAEGSTLFAAAGDVTISLTNGSLISYTINQGNAQALINAGGLIKADGGQVILTAKGIDSLSHAVVNSIGVIEAQTVNNKRGVIELSSDLVSGAVNVTNGKLDASAPTTGNGGLIKTSANQVEVDAAVTTRRVNQASLPPTTSGWELTANNINVEFSGGTVSSSVLGTALDNGNVTLKAVGTATTHGNIDINDATSWSANTALGLNATKDINFNSDLSLMGDKAKLALNFGVANDYNLNNGARINLTGSNPSLFINNSAYTVINELGEEGDATATTLQGMKNNLTGNYALGSDIDASDTVNWNGGRGFEPIGGALADFQTYNSGTTAYKGNFHGLGHVVDHLSIHIPTSETITSLSDINELYRPIGLFGIVQGNLRDIGITSASVSGWTFIGSLVGMQLSGDIKHAFSSGNVSGSFAGGLVGANGQPFGPSSSSRIIDSYSQSDVKGAGGLVGWNSATIQRSYASGQVSGGATIGGLVGQNINGTIQDSYATGDVNGIAGLAYTSGDKKGYILNAGGLIGISINSEISNSYATGNVRDITENTSPLDWATAGHIGGLIGSTGSSTITNSYATGSATASNLDNYISSVGGLIGSTDKTIISNSHAVGNVVNNTAAAVDSYFTANSSGAGGLIGSSHTDTISNSYAAGNVDGNNFIGGLVGSSGGTVNINNSYATGSATGHEYVGGLLGLTNSSGINISNSYASGNVRGGNYVGGLIGRNFGTTSHSNASGSVIGNDYVGGLIGSNEVGSVSDSSAIGTVDGHDYVGGLIGSVISGSARNNYATGSVNGHDYVGGFIGFINVSEASDNYATGSVIGNDYVGGLLGSVNNSNTSNSYATGSVNGHNSVGGLIGFANGNTSNSYATGNVNGNDAVGGLIGTVNYYNTSTSKSYSSGQVTGLTNAGGLVGVNNSNNTVTDSYWNIETSGQTTSNGGIGKTSAELKQISTFTGWDIADISDLSSTSTWVIDQDNDTPKLRQPH